MTVLNRDLEQSPMVIEVEGLTKVFGSFTAVDHISFDVRRGEIFGFLGANGAGKSTAMRMLCGLLKPDGGRGTVAGKDIIHANEEIKKHIGYMSQRFSLYDMLTVQENIVLFAGIYQVPRREIMPRCKAMLEQLDFVEHTHTIVRELPPGWKQKLAFSIAVFHEPEIVFLDEPTGGVDPATRRRFWELIYDAAFNRGITVFVTTHYMDEAEYCDRLSIMVDGQIRAMGAPSELKARYQVEDMDALFKLITRE